MNQTNHEDDGGSRSKTFHLHITQHLRHVTFTRTNEEQSTTTQYRQFTVHPTVLSAGKTTAHVHQKRIT